MKSGWLDIGQGLFCEFLLAKKKFRSTKMQKKNYTGKIFYHLAWTSLVNKVFIKIMFKNLFHVVQKVQYQEGKKGPSGPLI